jgi:putative DNA primase/helicase
MIHPDGRKLFITGQQTSGCFHVMGEPDGTIILAEGFATAASVRQATGHAAVVCFNCNNLGIVAGIMRRKYPAAAIIIAGDDDKWTDGNPGRTKAEETAAKVGAAAIFPVFKNPEKGKTDFNDLHCTEGLDTVREQLTKNDVQPEPTGFIPLGSDGENYYFFKPKSRSIINTRGFSETFMYELMPLEHWESAYANKRGVNWAQAKSDIIQASIAVGFFDEETVRGAGVWLDNNRIVVNTTDGIDGEQIKSSYTYIHTSKKIPSLHKKPLLTSETKHLLRACEALNWQDFKSSKLLAGWIAISRIAGALPVRPHVWLTGGAGNGKSTIMEKLVQPALGGKQALVYCNVGTTSAGIRQEMGRDSVPLIFDEFETNSENTKETIAACIELFRQSWSMSGGSVVKGSSVGTAKNYSMNMAALVTSIRVGLDNDADRSRFSVLELLPHNSDNEKWSMIASLLEPITTEYGDRLFSRMVKMIPVVMENYKIYSDALASIVNRRFGQQVGMLLAGWSALEMDTPVSASDAKDEVDKFIPTETDKKESAEASDAIECLNHLLEWPVRTRQGIDKTISQLMLGDPEDRKYLETLGILVKPAEICPTTKKMKSEAEIFIAKRHSVLIGLVFRKTSWQKTYARSIMRALPTRLDAADCRVTIAGKQVTCIRTDFAELKLTK